MLLQICDQESLIHQIEFLASTYTKCQLPIPLTFSLNAFNVRKCVGKQKESNTGENIHRRAIISTDLRMMNNLCQSILLPTCEHRLSCRKETKYMTLIQV